MRVVHVGHDVSGDPGPPRLSKVGEQSGVFCSGLAWSCPIHALVLTGLIIIAHSSQLSCHPSYVRGDPGIPSSWSSLAWWTWQ